VTFPCSFPARSSRTKSTATYGCSPKTASRNLQAVGADCIIDRPKSSRTDFPGGQQDRSCVGRPRHRDRLLNPNEGKRPSSSTYTLHLLEPDGDAALPSCSNPLIISAETRFNKRATFWVERECGNPQTLLQVSVSIFLPPLLPLMIHDPRLDLFHDHEFVIPAFPRPDQRFMHTYITSAHSLAGSPNTAGCTFTGSNQVRR
jgi:hypothetical protein